MTVKHCAIVKCSSMSVAGSSGFDVARLSGMPAAAIFFVPPFVETPLLFSIIVATWCGTLLYLAISDRTARSYVFMLAGYTMPLVALPTVTDPSTVFDVAIARTEEIVLGIVCASVVGSAVFPNRLAPTLIERTVAWFKDAAVCGHVTLS